jgi:hypothetical protein
MTGTFGLKRDDSWFNTSVISWVCFRVLRIFMIRTMEAFDEINQFYQKWYAERCGKTSKPESTVFCLPRYFYAFSRLLV